MCASAAALQLHGPAHRVADARDEWQRDGEDERDEVLDDHEEPQRCQQHHVVGDGRRARHLANTISRQGQIISLLCNRLARPVGRRALRSIAALSTSGLPPT